MVRLAYFNQKCQEIVQQSSSRDFRDKEKTEGGGKGGKMKWKKAAHKPEFIYRINF